MKAVLGRNLWQSKCFIINNILYEFQIKKYEEKNVYVLCMGYWLWSSYEAFPYNFSFLYFISRSQIAIKKLFYGRKNFHFSFHLSLIFFLKNINFNLFIFPHRIFKNWHKGIISGKFWINGSGCWLTLATWKLASI